jgi:hypothetical protein
MTFLSYGFINLSLLFLKLTQSNKKKRLKLAVRYRTQGVS